MFIGPGPGADMSKDSTFYFPGKKSRKLRDENVRRWV